MFNKKCPRCARKIDKDYEFCPYCGFNIKKEEDARDFGFLGREDNFELPELGVGTQFGLDKIFSSLLKQIDTQFKEMDRGLGGDMTPKKITKEKLPPNARGISISITTSSNRKPEIKVRGFGPGFENRTENAQEPVKEIKRQEISEEKARKIAKLPKQEAETNVRRLSNKIVYEISLPGIERQDNIIINKLENSIEIKAFSKDKVYFKLLPVNLPIINHKLENEKLILELKAN